MSILIALFLEAMSDLKHRSIQIGSNVSLIFETLISDSSSSPHENKLNAMMAIKFSDKQLEEGETGQLSGLESQVWLQVGENERVFSYLQEDTKDKDKYSLLFTFTNLMIKDLQAGSALFAGVNHPNYNVRTKEIPRIVFDSLAQDLSKS